MKRITIGLLLAITFITACGQAPSATPTALIPVVEQATSTPSPTPTRTSLPSATPTASITPLPTIPTFTPTFDVSTIVTVTPALQVECPEEEPSLIPDFPYCDMYGCEDASYHEQILEFLNAGGTHKAIFNAFPNPPLFPESGGLVSKDFTGDGMPELVYSTSFDGLFIFGCAKGKYIIQSNVIQTKFSYEILSAKDMNSDGLPEIVIADRDTGGVRMLSIYTWDGQDFQSKVRISRGDQTIDVLLMDWVHEITLEDVDHNGTIEVVMSGGVASKNDIYAIGLPWREAINMLAWNGSYFVLSYVDYTPPEYRFQALQDADREMDYGRFDKAQSYYQDVIFNENLDWWSKERREYERYNSIHSFLELISRGMSENPTPYPTLPTATPDLSEYPRLAAYAYYRILLLHLVQGQGTDAATTYTTLEQTFGDDPYARPYVEMATAFWITYQATQRMYDACAAAIQYAAEHPEILTPLGSDYHGVQSHIYVPEDICPFR